MKWCIFQVDLWIELCKVDWRRELLVLHGQNNFEQAGDSCCRLHVPQVALDWTDAAASGASAWSQLAIGILYALYLNRISQGGAGAVSFYIGQILSVNPGILPGGDQ